MKSVFIVSLTLLAVVGLVCAQIATAQSRDFVIINMEDRSDAGHPQDAAQIDAGQSTGDAVDGGVPAIQIDRLGYAPKLPVVDPTPRNDRRSIEAALIARAKHCVGTQTADPGDADVGFVYLVRAERPHATLTVVTDDAGLHVSRLEVDILRMLGDTRAINVRGKRRLFRECLEVVPLDPRPVVTERVAFRLKSGALTLRVLDLQWSAL